MKKNQKKIILFSFFLILLVGGNANVGNKLENNNASFSKEIDSDSLLLQQFNRAVEFLRKGEFQYSQQSFENAIQTVKNGDVKDNNLIYRTYVNYGVLLNRIGNWKNALDNYNFAEEFTLQKFGLESNKLTPIYVNIGNIFSTLGDLVKAQNYYQKAISLLEIHQDSRWLSQTYNNLGILFYKQKNYSESLSYYLKTLD